MMNPVVSPFYERDGLETRDGQLRKMRENWPFYWVSRVNARYVQVLERQMKPLGLDMPRWRVLISLHEAHYLSVTEIAEFSVIKLTTATKVVQRMILDDLVTTRVRPADGRVTEVTMTEKGDQMRRLAMAEAEKILTGAFIQISQEEMGMLNGMLEKVFLRLRDI